MDLLLIVFFKKELDPFLVLLDFARIDVDDDDDMVMMYRGVYTF